MPVSNTPWAGTLTLTTANTPYQLSQLLSDVPAARRPIMGNPPRAQFVAIQANPDAGGARFYIGNPDLSTTNYGALIYATQVWPIYSMDVNLIRLDHIYLACDTNAETVNVLFITR